MAEKIKPKTARGFTARLKACLESHGIQPNVKSRTISFSGFGYGSGCTADVTVASRLSEAVVEDLRKIQTEFQTGPGGPEFSEKFKSSFLVSLRGPAYPCGGRI